MKFLIVGLGNIGSEYAHTRHNIGFDTLDAFAEASNVVFEDKRYGAIATAKVKGHQLILLKPSTYMNLSGNAVRYWMQQENIPLEQVLVIVDDLALPFGALRLKGKGSDVFLKVFAQEVFFLCAKHSFALQVKTRTTINDKGFFEPLEVIVY